MKKVKVKLIDGKWVHRAKMKPWKHLEDVEEFLFSGFWNKFIFPCYNPKNPIDYMTYCVQFRKLSK